MTDGERPAAPGAGTRTPSAAVDLVIAFTNSEDHELGTDDLATSDELTLWLVDHGLLRNDLRATDDDLVLSRRLRAGLHAALVANHDGRGDYASLEEAAAELPLTISTSGGRPGLRPVRDGIPGAVSRVLIAVNETVAEGAWPRIKICSADTCRWAYFDATKNRSREYCEWGCGNKIKSRNYRARKKAAATSALPD